MDSNLITPNNNNEQIPKPIENEFYSNSCAPTPVQDPQNYTPQEYINQDFQPQTYSNNPYQPYSFCTNQPQYYSTNPNQKYSYCTNQSQHYPNDQQNKVFTSSFYRARKLALLVMCFIQFFFVVIEIIIVFILIDEILIFVVSILFFLSYLDKCKINSKLRTILTGIVLFVGFGMRSIAMIKNNASSSILIVLMILRGFILFFSILFSVLDSEAFNILN